MGVLNPTIVTENRELTSRKFVGMPKNKGFVPHFQLHKNGTTLQVAEIDPVLFLKKNAFVSQLFDGLN